MHSYELTIVLPEKATPAKEKVLGETISKMVKTYKGKLEKTDSWGKLPLSYPIDKNTSGVFIHFLLELDGASAHDMSQKLRLEKGMLRYLLIRK